MMRNFRAKLFGALLALAMVLVLPIRPLAHESPVDHVDRAIRIWIEGETIYLRYQLQLSERAALMQLKVMDANADGVVSDTERDAYFASFAGKLAPHLRLEIGEHALEIKPAGRAELLPQFRQVFLFSAPIGALKSGTHAGKLSDEYSRNYPGVYRWDGAKEHAAGPRVQVKEAPKAQETAGHPAVLTMKFEIVVP
jgi:hypothetical protein